MLTKKDFAHLISADVKLPKKLLAQCAAFAYRTYLNPPKKKQVMYIKGGFGTGKTTLLNAMHKVCNQKVTMFIDDGVRVKLLRGDCFPTGKFVVEVGIPKASNDPDIDVLVVEMKP